MSLVVNSSVKKKSKKVKCVACGWKVGEEIVTPAKVEEIEN